MLKLITGAVFPYLRFAPWILMGLAVMWALWERDDRKDAELALANQKTQIVTDANNAWVKVDKAREGFDEQVAVGLAKINEKQRQMEATIDDYRKAVAADPGGRVLLTPAERAALRLLSSRAADNPAGGGAVRGADAPAPMR